MKEIKEILKTKSYVINPIILKNINKLNITLNEFLLMLYFINEKNNSLSDPEGVSKAIELENILNNTLKKSQTL